MIRYIINGSNLFLTTVCSTVPFPPFLYNLRSPGLIEWKMQDEVHCIAWNKIKLQQKKKKNNKKSRTFKLNFKISNSKKL